MFELKKMDTFKWQIIIESKIVLLFLLYHLLLNVVEKIIINS